jgi:TatD family-associated radical SAM protein
MTVVYRARGNIYLNITNRCSSDCVFCLAKFTDTFHGYNLRLDEVIAVTEWLALRRISARLDTNGHGQLLHPERDVAHDLAAAGLGAVSVSLVAHNSEVYNQLCRPMFSKAYRAVLKFAEDCLKEGMKVTLSVVDLPEVDIEACRDIAQKMGAEFRVRKLLTPDSEEVKA